MYHIQRHQTTLLDSSWNFRLLIQQKPAHLHWTLNLTRKKKYNVLNGDFGQKRKYSIRLFAWLTCFKLCIMGIGVTGSRGGPMLSHHEYLASSVLIMVQQAPSFMISLLASLGHAVAWNCMMRSCERHKYMRSESLM